MNLTHKLTAEHLLDGELFPYNEIVLCVEQTLYHLNILGHF